MELDVSLRLMESIDLGYKGGTWKRKIDYWKLPSDRLWHKNTSTKYLQGMAKKVTNTTKGMSYAKGKEEPIKKVLESTNPSQENDMPKTSTDIPLPPPYSLILKHMDLEVPLSHNSPFQIGFWKKIPRLPRNMALSPPLEALLACRPCALSRHKKKW